MGIVAAANIQTAFPAEIIQNSGALVVISLIVSIFIELLISDSRYWDAWSKSTLDATIKPLLMTFAAIILYRLILII